MGSLCARTHFALLAFHFSLVTAFGQLAIKGETVYTMTGEPIKNGVVLINNGKIEAVGKDLAIPSDYRVIDAKGKVVLTPSTWYSARARRIRAMACARSLPQTMSFERSGS